MNWTISRGTGPVVITAIHAGHQIRDELGPYLALDAQTRLREEDPYTDQWTTLSSQRVVVHTSRFEVDLNRALGSAIYMVPEDAWGLTVWRTLPPDAALLASRNAWKSFYDDMAAYLDALHAAYGSFVVLDIHSYCHRRGGPLAPFDDPERNPEVNLGTASVQRPRWASLIERFMADLRAFDVGDGQKLDVRENVNFRGGHFSRWINQRYGHHACALAIEFKKTFMDEWTGELHQAELEKLKQALEYALPGICENLDQAPM